MVIQFFEIAENNIKEFKSQLKIAYKNHFKNTKSFKEAFKDFSVPEISISNDLYFEDIEKAKKQLYEDKKSGEEIYMKDFISDLQENLSFVPIIKAEKETEYDPGHSFTVEEMIKIKKWQKQHRAKNHPEGETYQGAVGVDGAIHYAGSVWEKRIRNCKRGLF